MRLKVGTLAMLLGPILTGCDSLHFNAVKESTTRNWSVGTLSRLKTNLSGYVDSSLLGNYKAITVDPEKKEILLSLPAPNLFQNWERSIPKLAGAILKATVNDRDQSSILLRYPLRLLISHFEKGFGDKTGLPNGQSIPGIPGGKLHSEKIVIDKNHEVHIYFDKGIVSMLLSVPYDPMLITTIPVKKTAFGTGTENVLGFTNTIPKGSGEFGGLLLSALIPPSSLKLLERE